MTVYNEGLSCMIVCVSDDDDVDHGCAVGVRSLRSLGSGQALESPF